MCGPEQQKWTTAAIPSLSRVDAALALRQQMRVAKPDRVDTAGRRRRVARLDGSSTESNLFPTAAELCVRTGLAETVAPLGRWHGVGGCEGGM